MENELKGSASTSSSTGKSDLRYSDVKPPRYENMSPVKRSIEKVLRERSSNLGDRISPHASPQKGIHVTPKSRIYSSVQRAQQSPNSPVSPLTSYLLKNTPVNMEPEPIRDNAALEKLLQNIETTTRMWQSDTTGAEAAGSSSGTYLFTSAAGGVSTFSTSPSVPKFKAASKLSATADRVVKERIEDGLVVKDPATVIFDLKIDPYIDEWTENVRKWLSNKVLGPLVARIDAVDKAFRENNLSDLDCSNTVAPGTNNMFVNRGLGPSQDQSAARLLELAQKYPNMQIVKERQKLEHFLHFPDYSCRPYIISRIGELARGGCLSAFQWNSGGPYQGRPFNQDQLPTDDQLVMRLFCCFLDEMMPGENSGIYGSKPFTNKYYLPVDSKPDVMRSIQIRHYTKHPAHYNLIVEKMIWDVYPKRNNVFQTLVLFTYYVKLVAGGYLGLLNLGGNSINLLSIFPQKN